MVQSPIRAESPAFSRQITCPSGKVKAGLACGDRSLAFGDLEVVLCLIRRVSFSVGDRVDLETRLVQRTEPALDWVGVMGSWLCLR
ncbi:uncharacterized protein BDW43DRAFT_227681 [Aspergillus alliaceus]|uniref:uncharacterized protein n=1 Tax=Petromyces alliaceus TaxID=209559 RepID=UPI0012A3F73A|nr:uncharacterized protein BDW43DRAFT_227681 [Aspergillus alliaceus]KAB8236897.1 hypothetical protein BDW43DRAFT_227681 [Aspergillus alliaceus]